MIENGDITLVELHYILAFRRYKLNIFRYLAVSLLVVDMNTLECRAEHITQHTYYTAFLLEYQCRGCRCACFSHCLLPASQKSAELMMKISHTFTFG